jgi:zinc transporter ZupT
MVTAVIYGLLASSSFVVGVLLGLATKPPRRLLAVVIAFGAGVLVSALTFDLMGEAFERETGAYAIGGFLVGTGAMREEGRSRGYIIGVWTGVAVACVLATVAGYALLAGLSPSWVSAVLALAAGGILALLADTMFPEAFEHGGRWVALATAVGFACAFLLSELTGSA